MPAILAHWAVAQEVAKRFKSEREFWYFQGREEDRVDVGLLPKDKKDFEQISRYFYFGANGPDLPYFRRKSGKSEWADMFHYNKQGEFLLELVLIIKNLPKNEASRERALAYALGHATHIAVDSMVHPYVNCFAGAYPEQFISEMHRTCECHQDSYLGKEYFRRMNVHSGPSWKKFVPPATQIAVPTLPGVTIINDDVKNVLDIIDKAFKKTHGNSPGIEDLIDCYENYYDVVLDEAYDKGVIIIGLIVSDIPTDPHPSLVNHEKLEPQIKYSKVLLERAVEFAEELCKAVISLFKSNGTEEDKNGFREKIKNWNLDNGYWIEVKMEDKKLKIIWRNTWC